MVGNISAKFHDHNTSGSKNIERGRFYPPGAYRVKYSLRGSKGQHNALDSIGSKFTFTIDQNTNPRTFGHNF